MIQDGANVNAKNDTGTTPLMIAAGNNPNPEVLKILLDADADLNAKDALKYRSAGRLPYLVFLPESCYLLLVCFG